MSLAASPTPLLHRVAAALAALLWCAALGLCGAMEFGRVGSLVEAATLIGLFLGGSCLGGALFRADAGRVLGWLALSGVAVAAASALAGCSTAIPPASALALGLAAGQVAAAVGGVWLVPLGSAVGWSAAALAPELIQRSPAGAVAALPVAALSVAVAMGARRAPPSRLARSAVVWGALGVAAAVGVGAWRVLCEPWPEAAAPWLAAAAVPAGLTLAGARPWHGWLGLVLAALSFGAWPGAAPMPATWRTLVAEGRFAACYDRSDQSMRILKNGLTVARSGPDLPVEAAAATVVRAVVGDRQRVLVLGGGVGRWPSALAAARLPLAQVATVHDVPATVLQATMAVGPVRVDEAPVTGVAVPALERVRRLPSASRAAIVVGDLPGSHAAWQSTVVGQRELRRVVGDGLLVQPFDLVETDVAYVRGVLAAAAAAQPWNAVLQLGDLCLLVSANAPGFDATASDVAGWSDWLGSARWLAHQAHLGEPADLRRAMLGRVAPWLADRAVDLVDPPPAAGGAGRAVALSALAEALVLEDRAVDPCTSLFGWWRRTDAELRLAADKLRELDRDRAAQAPVLAAQWLPIGAPRAELQAALGLAGPDGEPLADPAAAALRAHAIDPTLRPFLPQPFAALPVVRQVVGDLEDLAELPPAERLAEIAVGRSPRAVALRARFGSAVANALVAALAEGPPTADAFEALRELADPFVLREAAAVLAPRGRLAELVGYWRSDLPLPAALRDLARQEPLPLLPSLARRTDLGSRELLAELLVEAPVDVRRAAARALVAGPYARLDYDPEGSAEARKDAAARLRAWHDRGP